MKKYPKETRSCIACRKKNNKYEMHRFVVNNGVLLYDDKFTKGGKGLYLCKDINCLNKLVEKKGLNKLFKKKVDSQMYDIIREVLVAKKEQ